jgi:hypothetical protein
MMGMLVSVLQLRVLCMCQQPGQLQTMDSPVCVAVFERPTCKSLCCMCVLCLQAPTPVHQEVVWRPLGPPLSPHSSTSSPWAQQDTRCVAIGNTVV